MNTKQAKDFLAAQTVEQAALENIPLSDIEKRMMYFTESDTTSCDDAIGLNEEFEAQFDSPEYEVKISRLLRHAYKRLNVEDPEKIRNWDRAIRLLRRGDHYILVLWDLKSPTEHRTRDFFALVGTGVLIVLLLVAVSVFTAEHNIDIAHYRSYLWIVALGVFLFATGLFRSLYRLAVVWFYRGRVEKPDR
jgi:hypothetical protein